MRTLNYNCFEAQEKIIRLKSDNYDCYVDAKTYQDILLTMSSGDHATHKAFEVYVGTHRLDEIKLVRWDDENQGYWFQENYDSWFEREL